MNIALSVQLPQPLRPGVPARGHVIIQNSTHIVHAVQLSMIGVRGDWIRLSASQVNIYPGEPATIEVIALAPRGPEVVAGLHRIGVRAVAADDPAARAAAEAEVEVERWASIETDLRPARTRGTRPARTSLEVTNLGNAPYPIHLEGGDDHDLVAVDLKTRMFVLDPGERRRVRLRVRAGDGSAGSLPYWVRVRASDGSVVQSAAGNLTVRPSWWGRSVRVLAVLGCVAVGAAVVGTQAGLFGPSVRSAVEASESPVPTLEPAEAAAPHLPASTTPTTSFVAEAIAPPDTVVLGAPSAGPTASPPPPGGASGGQDTGGGQADGSETGGSNGTSGDLQPPGEAPPSRDDVAPVTEAPSRVVPGAPSFVEVVAADGVIDVAWGAPGNVAEADVDHYTVRWTVDGTVAGEATVQARERSFTGLVNGQAYAFEVTATSSDGVTGPAASSAAAVPSGPPIATLPIVDTLGSTTATISWEPFGDNGAPIIDYSTTVTASNGEWWTTSTGIDARLEMTALVPETTYRAIVVATSAGGTTMSPEISFTTNPSPIILEVEPFPWWEFAQPPIIPLPLPPMTTTPRTPPLPCLWPPCPLIP